jgi:hypothetical protein
LLDKVFDVKGKVLSVQQYYYTVLLEISTQGSAEVIGEVFPFDTTKACKGNSSTHS